LALPVSHRIWGWLAALTIIILLGWLFLGHYTRREHVAGRLAPDAGLIRVTARTTGTVAGLHAAEGDHVKAGQILLGVAGDRIGLHESSGNWDFSGSVSGNNGGSTKGSATGTCHF